MIEASTDVVVNEAVYPHPIELVWKALTDPEILSDWLLPATDFSPEVGRKFTLKQREAEGWSGVVECEVLELDPPSRMRWSWNAVFPGGVTFELEPTADGGTRVRVAQTGFDNAGDFAKQARGGANYFWGKQALPGSLREVIEKLAQA